MCLKARYLGQLQSLPQDQKVTWTWSQTNKSQLPSSTKQFSWSLYMQSQIPSSLSQDPSAMGHHHPTWQFDAAFRSIRPRQRPCDLGPREAWGQHKHPQLQYFLRTTHQVDTVFHYSEQHQIRGSLRWGLAVHSFAIQLLVEVHERRTGLPI